MGFPPRFQVSSRATHQMTTLPLILITAGYALVFVIAAYFTRAMSRRVAGALAGGAAAGLVCLGLIVLGEALRWWKVPLLSTPFLLFLGLAISLSPIYLVTWRIVRRFGWRGLAVFTGAVTIIGAPRDYFIASKFPEWMVFSPGIVPIIADAVTYGAVVVLLGHAVMRLVSGPARADRLAREQLGVIKELEPFRATLQGIAVESTFNWYWLVDGLRARKFPAMLVNTAAIQQYEGLKRSDDDYDAWWLAHMMRLGILPKGYIYPREERAVRDLLRKRATLVQQRTANILSVQNLEAKNRGTKISSNEVKHLTSTSIAALYENEDLALAITTTLAVIDALTKQTSLRSSGRTGLDPDG